MTFLPEECALNDPARIIHALIEVGEAGVAAIPAVLADSDSAWRQLMCGDEPWLRTAECLDEFRLRALIRGLVLFGQASGWSGGSVSPVLPLYRAYIARFPGEEPAMTGWIVFNRVNDHEPFGTPAHGGARTLAEYGDYLLERQREIQAEEDLKQEAHRMRLRRDADSATQNFANAVRRGDTLAVEALLAKGADWRRVTSASGSLVAIAEANNKPGMAAFLLSRGID